MWPDAHDPFLYLFENLKSELHHRHESTPYGFSDHHVTHLFASGARDLGWSMLSPTNLEQLIYCSFELSDIFGGYCLCV